MTRDETKKVLMVMQSAFPNYKPTDLKTTVDTWYTMLKDYTYQAVMTALQAYIATEDSGFAPSIGQITNKIYKIENPREETGMEAWAMVMDAVRDGAYHSGEKYNALPRNIQRAVGSAEQIHSMAIDDHFNEDVARSNFLKAYNRVTEQEEEIAKYPENVRRLIDDTLKRLEG